MKTIRAGAEYQLKDELESLRALGKGDWGGLWFQLSTLRSPHVRKELEKAIFGIITDAAVEKEGGTFFCEDGDVILIANPFTVEDWRKIIEGFQPFLPVDYADTEKLVVYFKNLLNDVSLDVICAEKIKAIRERVTDPRKSIKEAPDVKVPNIHSALFLKAMENRAKRMRPCILLVEDDPASMYLAKRTLWQDYDVLTAANGSEALAVYTTNAPDIVFLDIGLPDTSGHRVLEKLVYLDPHASVVMLSGNSFRDEIVKAMKEGAKGFIAKPFSRAKLIHYINQLVPQVMAS